MANYLYDPHLGECERGLLMATTTNFGWETPDDSDLVKDGAQSIRTLGSSIDTTLVDLKGGTTGQVLSKATNTDMDFVWVTPDDADAIQNSIIDAKGDLIAATAADTPARLAVGSNGQVLTADSTTATGLKWATASAGGLTLLSTTTLSGSTVQISSISQDYTDLKIIVNNATFNAASGYDITFYNGTTALQLAYTGTWFNGTATVAGAFTARNTIGGDFAFQNITTPNGFEITISRYSTTQYAKPFTAAASWYASSSERAGVAGGVVGLNSNSPINKIQVALSQATTFSGGTVYIYGIK